jgi:hypothetical protein
MKKSLAIIAFGIALLVNTNIKAQINLNVNIGSQPLWGPTGYDHAEYYYLPDIETYYSVPKQQYVYQNNGNWVFANSLPARYSNYNIYNGYKVVINEPTPYLNFKTDKVKYAKYKNWGGKQLVIKNSNDKKYYVVKGHPHGMPPGQAKKIYNGTSKANGNGQGKGSGNGNGKGKGKH